MLNHTIIGTDCCESQTPSCKKQTLRHVLYIKTYMSGRRVAYNILLNIVNMCITPVGRDDNVNMHAGDILPLFYFVIMVYAALQVRYVYAVYPGV